MTIYAAPICVGCTHFTGYERPTREQREQRQQLAKPLTGTCRAFPRGIPLSIWQSSDDHRNAVEGDNGIRFLAKDKSAEQYAEVLFEE